MTKIHKDYYRLAAENLLPPPLPSRQPILAACVPVSKTICFLSVSALAFSFIPRPAVSEARVTNAVMPKLEQRIDVMGEALEYLLESANASQGGTTPRTVTVARTCRITVPKANLRIGPGKSYSALMAVAEGTELLVEEDREGWLRVIAPSGEAAWVSKAVTTHPAA